ncbi:hypothetical protein [Aurantimonas coralicida]|uniref:hypothetical protein n=1 Tax=Aurantimonas coralicida TaxID=182270 RepID=UPI001D182185|nr:hypothetical protein [Aurantimonas coralicida]MCC4296283.1 hypothetical protein [Aurantimonas coralicida]
MKPIVPAACAVVLAACTTPNPQVPAPVSASLARICQFEPVAHAAFVALTEGRRVSARVVTAERNAHIVVTRICADPPTDAVAALATASAAYADILEAQSRIAKEI